MLPFNMRQANQRHVYQRTRPATVSRSIRRHKGVICEEGELLANEIFTGPITEEMSKIYKAFFLHYTSTNLRHLNSAGKIDHLQDQLDQVNGKLHNMKSIDRAGRYNKMKKVRASRMRFNRDVLAGCPNPRPSQNEIRRHFGKQRWTKAQKTARNMAETDKNQW